MPQPWETPPPEREKQKQPWETAPPVKPRESPELARILARADREYLLPILGAPADIVGWAADIDEVPFGREWLARHTGIKDIPEPKTAIGRGTSEALGAGVTAPLTGGVMGKGVEIFGTTLGKPAVEAAGRTMAEAFPNIASGIGSAGGGEAGGELFKGTPMEPVARKVGELIGAFGGGLAGAKPSHISTKTDDILRAYERLGLNPSAAEAGIGGRDVALLQGNVLPQMAGSAGVIHNAAKRNFERLVEVQQEIAQQYGTPGVSKYAEGKELQDAILKNWSTAKSVAGASLERAGTLFKPDETFYAQHFIDAISKPVGAGTTSAVRAKTVDPLVTEAASMVRANGGHFTFDDMKALQGKYGNALDRSYAMGADDAQVSQLRSAIRKDIDEAVKSRGPGPYNDYKLAQVAYAKSMSNYRQAFKKLLGTKDLPIKPEAVYDIVTGAANNDLRMLKKVWDGLGPAKQGELSATVLSRMGNMDEANIGNLESWSLGKFLSTYAKMSAEGKDILFKSTGNVKLQQAMDDLVLAAQQMKTVEKVASTSKSGTAGAIMAQGASGAYAGYKLAGIPGAAAGILVNIAGPYAAAKMLTNPTAVRFVAQNLRDMEQGTQGVARAAINLGVFKQ